MCQFGDESKILSEQIVPKEIPLIGWRSNWIINSFTNKEKFLESLTQGYIWPKMQNASGKGLERNNELGIYNYRYYNYIYNYHYYDYDYSKYNYNYEFYNNNNNNNNNNNSYKIQIKTKHWGKVFTYNDGYRSEFCYLTHLVILDKDSEWFKDDKTIEFANHFNDTIIQLAKEYGCEVLEWIIRDKGII